MWVVLQDCKHYILSTPRKKSNGRVKYILALIVGLLLPNVEGVCSHSQVRPQSATLLGLISEWSERINSTIFDIIQDIMSSGSLTGPPG